MADEQSLIRWSEALAAIARTGLGFTQNLYEQERFEEVLHIAADIRAQAADGPQPETQVDEWMKSVGSGVPGYVTPKIAIGAVVGNDDGELLLIQRSDSGVWLFPTGWADPGYSAAEIAEKEVLEETGIEAEAVRLNSVLDGVQHGMSRFPMYSLVFQCRMTGGVLRPHPLECSDQGFFAEGALPEPLAGVRDWADHAFRAIRGETLDVRFDRPRKPAWREPEDST